MTSAECPHCGATYTGESALRLARSCADACRRQQERGESYANLWNATGDQWISLYRRLRGR